MKPYCRPDIAAMAGYTPGEQPRDRRYIKLNTNENPYPPSPAVRDALSTFTPDDLRLYPDPLALELRRQAARTTNNKQLTEDWVIAGNGSDDLLTIAVRTFVGQEQALAYPDPTYSLYPVLAQLQGAQTRPIPLDQNFELPPNFTHYTTDARLLFIARPNAPTGNSFDMQRMQQVCNDFPGIVWIDEAYADFADNNCLELVDRHPNVVVSRTLSKSYSLAGLRLGLAYANPRLINEMMKVKDSYNVNMLTQKLALAALGDTDWMQRNSQRIRATREHIGKELRSLGFHVQPSQANFIFTQPPLPAVEYLRQLRQEGILVRHFPGERTGNYVRITIGTDDDMAQLLQVTARILQDSPKTKRETARCPAAALKTKPTT